MAGSRYFKFKMSRGRALHPPQRSRAPTRTKNQVDVCRFADSFAAWTAFFGAHRRLVKSESFRSERQFFTRLERHSVKLLSNLSTRFWSGRARARAGTLCFLHRHQVFTKCALLKDRTMRSFQFFEIVPFDLNDSRVGILWIRLAAARRGSVSRAQN